jgi:hypothetical protein
MRANFSRVFIAVVVQSAVWAQGSLPVFKGGTTPQEFCRKFPNALACSSPDYLNGKGLNVTNGLTLDQKTLDRLTKPSSASPHRPKMDAVPVVAPGGQVDWRFAHPNAAMLMSVNLRTLLSSPAMETVFNQISSQIGGQVPGIGPAELAKARAWMNNIDRLYISVQSATSNPQAVMIITGRFDNAFLSTLQVDPAKRAQFANASAILIGDPGSVAQATKRMTATDAPNALVQTAGAWASRYDLWVMGSPALLPSAALTGKKAAGVPDFASSIRSFSVGMTMASDVRVDAVLETTSPQVAEQMAAMIKSGAMQQAGMQEYSKNLHVSANGATLQISASVDQGQLTRGMSMRGSAGRRASSGMTGSSVAIPEAQPNPNAKPDRVVISGLDDGPKEIKLEDKK